MDETEGIQPGAHRDAEGPTHWAESSTPAGQFELQPSKQAGEQTDALAEAIKTAKLK